jgi:hypothetical protein
LTERLYKFFGKFDILGFCYEYRVLTERLYKFFGKFDILGFCYEYRVFLKKNSDFSAFIS